MQNVNEYIFLQHSSEAEKMTWWKLQYHANDSMLQYC